MERYTFFVSGISFVDIDDDKLPYCSRLWPEYGMKRTPTKAKKLQPVMHITCTTGSSHICHITPDVLDLKLADMLRQTIKELIPEEAMRPTHGFFIDRGYLELAKEQEVEVTNLIQMMREMGVKFLGTVKESLKFPYYFVEVNGDGKTVKNDRLVVQLYGMRHVWRATSRLTT